MLRESLAVQEWLEEGRAEGLAKARETSFQIGVALGLIEGLSTILSVRFPGVKTPESIRLITDKTVLEALIRKVVVARTADAALRAIKRASKQSAP